MKIVGVSFDLPQSNATFKADEGFQYDLWSDTNRELALYYGAATSPLAPFPIRMTVLLDPDGVWRVTYPLPGSGVGGLYAHAQLILDDLDKLVNP